MAKGMIEISEMFQYNNDLLIKMNATIDARKILEDYLKEKRIIEYRIQENV